MLQKFSARQNGVILCYRKFLQGKMETISITENFCGLNERHLGVEKISAG